MAHKKQGYRFEKDWPLETLETQVFKEFKAATTVPVNVRIKAEHLVLNLENVKQILSSAHTITFWIDAFSKRDVHTATVQHSRDANAAYKTLYSCSAAPVGAPPAPGITSGAGSIDLDDPGDGQIGEKNDYD